jgi:hypothetical protein
MTAKKKRATPASTPAAKKRPPAKQGAKAPAESHAAPPATAARDKKLSALDAAVRVLRETGQAMSCPELIAQMAAKGYWSSPKGKTPSATLYAALTREIQLKGKAARFVKTGPGRFAYRGTDA